MFSKALNLEIQLIIPLFMKMKQNFRSMKAEKIDRQEIFPTRHAELKLFILCENGTRQKLQCMKRTKASQVINTRVS